MTPARILVAAPHAQTLRESLAALTEADALPAGSAEEALRLAQGAQPQLILLDDDLPPAGGAAFCRSLRADSRLADVPVLLMATGTHHQEIELCRDRQCQKILFKPVSRQDLLDTLRAYLALLPLVPRPPRLAQRLEVRFGRAGRLTRQGMSIDLSTGGLFLHAAADVTTGTLLSIALHLPDRQPPLACRARVAWINQPESALKPRYPQGLGLQFLDLSPADRERLELFLRQDAPETFPATGEKNLDMG
ncbi:PilZ domain-containing protein [Geoalkalibacter sp.]|uniref:PilZ domain-containing protein n=1 Tax=Geoalkalibacter sp. TaxID=3041440 RepID=UPI00272ECD01|nr:PilZ domain-containing protein [Geoalkalibacter sp.]